MTMSPALGRRCLTSGISIAWLGATGIGDRILWLPGYKTTTTTSRQMSRRQQDGSGLPHDENESSVTRLDIAELPGVVDLVVGRETVVVVAVLPAVERPAVDVLAGGAVLVDREAALHGTVPARSCARRQFREADTQISVP